MTFEETMDQALDMLRRRGRVTYGALKRQYALDDAYLTDLKDAMLYADSHVVDDAGRGLRWTGEPLSTAQQAFEGVARFYRRVDQNAPGIRPPARGSRSLCADRPAGRRHH